MKWLLASALVIVVVASLVMWPETPRPEDPLLGTWASTAVLCRHGGLLVQPDTRLHWSPEGGELRRGNERPVHLNRAEVAEVLSWLSLLDSLPTDRYWLVEPRVDSPSLVVVERVCEGFNGEIKSAPDEAFGAEPFTGLLCGGLRAMPFVSCRIQQAWLALGKTRRHDRVEAFVDRLNALSVR